MKDIKSPEEILTAHWGYKYTVIPNVQTLDCIYAAMVAYHSQFVEQAEGWREADWTNKVLDWHQKFRVNIGSEPGITLTMDRFDMRENILLEEVGELRVSFEKDDIIGVADAICDILYVAIGTAIEFGLHEKLNELFSEIHRSNMSKLDENGQPVKRADGKILKSILFSRPNLKSILAVSQEGPKGEEK